MTNPMPTKARPATPLTGLRATGALFLTLAVLEAVAPARAQQAVDPSPGDVQGSFDGILHALDLKPKVAPAPDFVRTSRPAGGTDFIPVGRTHPERSDKVMTPAEIQAATAALDGARVVQQRRAGIKPPLVPLKNAKGAASASPKTGLH